VTPSNADSPDPSADVPSPIDFRNPADAEEWAATAMAKRPWREGFFSTFVAELDRPCSVGGRVLELGSGPGFLARRVLQSLPLVDYTALDFSPAMHSLAARRLGAVAERVRFVERDFREPGWTTGLAQYDAVVTLQAVHELRHKRHAVALYRSVLPLLARGGLFLMCDHIYGEGRMTDASLYMSLLEHENALQQAGFGRVQQARREGGLVLYRAQVDP
jgi:SAM-dependent methyltransferase